ncbi:MAG: beta-N-acetylhexosaminidase [Steroidobacteraceae bacterium]
MGTLVLASIAAGGSSAAEPSLIPWPAKVVAERGAFVVSGQTPICAGGAADSVARQLQAIVKEMQGLDLEGRRCGRGSAVDLVLSPSASVADTEGYILDVSATGIRIEARAGAGLFYGAMTAAQLLSTGAHGGAHDAQRGAAVKLRGMHIEDFPRFKWRGLMLDPARHFLSVGDVKTIMDQMSQHKLNVLHLHLTDDQGWRLQIKRYPQLTTIGAWRTPPSNGGRGDEEGVYGGFYTQEEIRDLVGYAAARYITLVPEIDIPGHAQAVVAAHPQLSVLGDHPTVSTNWGVNYYLYNTNAESLAFVKNVLDEVMDLFPGKYIHLGGDEAIKSQWKSSPAIQAQMKALGIRNEEALQSWFMEQLGRYLDEHGRTMVGWDEILQGGVPATATVMSWRGTQGAVAAARLGHDVVLSPAPTLYFDNLQSRRDDEPAGRLAIAALSQVYNFEVMPTVLSEEEGRHVLGAQANLWSEYLLSAWYVQHAAFPRVDALSEAVWSQPSSMSWAGFLERLPAQMQRYRQQGIAAADSAFAVDFQLGGTQLADGRTAALQAGAGTVTLGNQTAFGEIRYTLDGSEPTASARLYTRPLLLKLGTVIKAATFSHDGGLLAAARSYEFSAATLLMRSSNQLQGCPGGDLGLRLPLTPDSPATAPVYDMDVFHSCYVYPKALLNGTGALGFDIARLPRNYGLANNYSIEEAKDQVKSYPARTPFGELVVYQDRCESGPEIARAALPDPASSDNRLSFQVPIAPVTGEHNLCFIFTAPTDGPWYVIDAVKLLRQ